MENQSVDFQKVFGNYKSFDDYFLDPLQPYAMAKVFIDGKQLKASFTVEFTQKTNDHDTFKITTQMILLTLLTRLFLTNPDI